VNNRIIFVNGVELEIPFLPEEDKLWGSWEVFRKYNFPKAEFINELLVELGKFSFTREIDE
jgi:hypothetical protein